MLTPDGVKKMDSTMTVEFNLQSPNGNFPDLVSFGQLQRDHRSQRSDFGKWKKTFVGTGVFKL